MKDWEHHIGAEVSRDVDGDTFYVKVPAFNAVFTEDIRLAGIDTAEIFGVSKDSEEYQAGEEEKQFVIDWFDAADRLYLLTDYEKGEYGRWIADVENQDGDRLSEVLIDEYGESVIYDG